MTKKQFKEIREHFLDSESTQDMVNVSFDQMNIDECIDILSISCGGQDDYQCICNFEDFIKKYTKKVMVKSMNFVQSYMK